MFAGAVGCGESAGAVVPGTGFILRKVSAARTGLRPTPRFGLDRACEVLLTLPRLSASDNPLTPLGCLETFSHF